VDPIAANHGDGVFAAPEVVLFSTKFRGEFSE